MALINCPECGKENVSDSADSCPNCGYAIKECLKSKKRSDICFATGTVFCSKMKGYKYE